MSVYEERNIKLHEALSMDIEQRTRMWFIPGLHVNIEKLPENATHIKTMVIQSSKGKFAVAVELTAKKKQNLMSKKMEDFSYLSTILPKPI